MFNKEYLPIVLVFIVLLGGVFLSSSKIALPNLSSVSAKPSPTPIAQDIQSGETAIEIQVPGKDLEKHVIEQFSQGNTALDLTKAVTSVQTKGQGEQALVTSIDGYTADTTKHEFWSLYVNGSQVGAGTYKVQNGDIIMWKIETN